MGGWLSRNRRVLALTLFLLFPLILLYAQSRASSPARGPVVSAILDASSVVERSMLWCTEWISDAFTHYVDSVDSAEELSRLRRAERSIASKEAEIAALQRENEELKHLANVISRIDGPRPLGARVVGRTGTPMTRMIRLDRGIDDGIRRGDAVISADGAVGTVTSVSRLASDVMLLTDPASAVDIMVLRTRDQGVLRGLGDDKHYRAQVNDFDRTIQLAAGDVLVASGLASRFPPGVPVGVIDKVARPEEGLYLRAEVKPFVSFEKLETVSVLVGREPVPLQHLRGDEVVIHQAKSRNTTDAFLSPPPLLKRLDAEEEIRLQEQQQAQIDEKKRREQWGHLNPTFCSEVYTGCISQNLWRPSDVPVIAPTDANPKLDANGNPSNEQTGKDGKQKNKNKKGKKKNDAAGGAGAAAGTNGATGNGNSGTKTGGTP